MATITETLVIQSPVFRHEANIPSKYTCEGEGINPPLEIGNVPDGTASLVLIMDDPDAPVQTFDHWIVWDIPPGQSSIKENSIPGKTGKNSKGERAYTGPCPPSGTHRYFFKVYALDSMLGLAEGTDKRGVERAMEGHILASGRIIGLYKKGSEA